MESLEVYLSGDGYCSVCLRSSSETRLLRAADPDFFAAVQVNQVTPYLCGLCRARLRTFHYSRNLVLRSQYWLYNIHHSQPFVLETNKQTVLSELEDIKKDLLEKVIPLSASVSCDQSYAEPRAAREETRFLVEVKLDPERSTDGQRSETKIEIDSDGEPCRTWKLTDNNQTAADVISDTRVYSTERLCVLDSNGLPSKSVPKKCRTQRKGKSRYPDNMRRTPKINEAYDKIIVLDELDDVGYMLGDVMKERIKLIMLPESEFWRIHRERLTKPQYTNLPYKCASCAMAYQKEALYTKHMARHSPDMGAFSCHLCGTYHRTRAELAVHGSSHLRRYQCVECGHTGYNRQDVANHYFAEHSTLRFHCRYCRLQTKGPFLVREHILIKHKKRKEEATECPICKKMIRQRNRVRHAASHELAAPLRCADCGREFKNDVCLRQHAVKFHTTRPESVEECPVCKKSVPWRARAAHARLHAAAEGAFCAACQKTFTTLGGLKAHRDRAHAADRQRFTCHDCGSTYTSKAAVRRHISFLHMKLGGVACEVCGKMFSHLGDMHSHLRSVHQKHLARRDKLCDLCGKGFTTSKTLENHRLIHTGEKPHACRECGQAFRQRSALHTHFKLKHLKMKMKDILGRRRRRQEEAGYHLTSKPTECGPAYVCYECAAHLRRFRRLRERSLRAHALLESLLDTEDEITQEIVDGINRGASDLDSQLQIGGHKYCEIKSQDSVEPDSVKTESEVHDDEPLDWFMQVDDLKEESNGVDTFEPAFAFVPEEQEKVRPKTKRSNGAKKKEKKDPAKKEPTKKKAPPKKKDPPAAKPKRPARPKEPRPRKEEHFEFDTVLMTQEEAMEVVKRRQESANYTSSQHPCDLCFRGFWQASTLDKHMQKHDPKSGQYECDFCHFRLMNRTTLVDHIGYTHRWKYVCKKCPHICYKRDQAKLHDAYHNGATYQCKQCFATFTSYAALTKHIHRRHTTDNWCKICGLSFVGSRGIRAHMLSRHAGEELPEPEEGHSCGECDLKFTSAEALKMHRMVSAKHNVKGNSNHCELCGETFETRIKFVWHRRTMHGPYAPWWRTIGTGDAKGNPAPPEAEAARRPPAKKKMAGPPGLTAGKPPGGGRSENRNFMCELCGAVCQTVQGFKNHVNGHTGEKPFKCSLCPKAFLLKAQLQKHMRSHTQEKRDRCNICSKLFSSGANLKHHIKMVHLSKPVKCDICEKQFSNTICLKDHVKHVHLKVPYPVRRGRNRSQRAPPRPDAAAAPAELAWRAAAPALAPAGDFFYGNAPK